MPVSRFKPSHRFRFSVISAFGWLLVVVVCTLGFIAWGNDFNWEITPLNAYLLFPLLGILAFSIMWAHYVAGAIRDYFEFNSTSLKSFFQYTGYAVLILICLHPGLLILQRFRDGYGLPPGSYESYVQPGLGWITVLGSVSLLAFLAFELHRVFGKRSWWHWVLTAGDIAMLAIFYHGLRLGGQLYHRGWFQTLWVFYGLILIVILGRKYYLLYLKRYE